ncbi:hypothetical protein KIPB_013544, partial [Kipferlia bialata]
TILVHHMPTVPRTDPKQGAKADADASFRLNRLIGWMACHAGAEGATVILDLIRERGTVPTPADKEEAKKADEIYFWAATAIQRCTEGEQPIPEDAACLCIPGLYEALPASAPLLRPMMQMLFHTVPARLFEALFEMIPLSNPDSGAADWGRAVLAAPDITFLLAHSSEAWVKWLQIA